MGFLDRMLGGSSASVSVHDAQPRIKSYYVLDVRQREEFQRGHIEGAKLVPLNNLAQELNKLPEGQEILCVCRSGSRSGAATRRLNKAGFQAVNLRGGMLAWARAGLPVKKGKR